MCSRKVFLKITHGFKVHKDELNAKISCKESISSLGEHWLDHEGNTVNKQHITNTLEAASAVLQLHLEETMHMKNAILTDFFKQS